MRCIIPIAKTCRHRVLSLRTAHIFLLFFCAIPNPCLADMDGGSPLTDQEIDTIYSRGWELLSRIHIDKSGLDKAIALYEKVLADAPDNRDIYWKLSEITFKKAEAVGNHERSLEIYKKALNYAKTARKAFPDSVEAHFWVGCCSARIAEIINSIRALPVINEAKDELKLTIELKPAHRFAVLAGAVLAAIYIDMPWPLKNLKQAEKYATEAVEKDPNLTLASLTLAKVFKKQKRYGDAREEASRCLAIGKPTYLWDAELYNWPDARRLLDEMEQLQ